MEDTIVSISTALAANAVSIIRLSGKEAISIANKIFKGHKLDQKFSNTINYGHIIDKDETVDEVLVSIFRAPNSFTTEDVVEINCHGGIFVTNKILALILENGAREAEPGEFTKRAFLNGRIDLTQAEAVMDIIGANTEQSLKLANRGLRGDVRKLVKDFSKKILDCVLKIEVNIDYPEYQDEEQMTNEFLKPTVTLLIKEINEILSRSEASLIIKNGIDTAIIGKPNVGKSSLLNALLREERAIVTDIAGTTRDTIEARVNLGGIILNLIDTAGVRQTKDIVEKIGVEKSKKAISEADLIILMFDYNRPLDNDDFELLRITEDKKRIIVINKKDLQKNIDLSIFSKYLLISSSSSKDIEKLENEIKIVCKFNSLNNNNPCLTNVRQINLLKQAITALNEALKGIYDYVPVDLINIDLRNAWESLEEIVGGVSRDDLIDNLFANFCLGK